MIAQPYFIDLFGYKVNWTDESDGWNQEFRQRFISYNEKNLGDLYVYDFYSTFQTRNMIFTVQSKGVPSFTSTGYKKMKIPPLLFESILNSKSMATKIEPELCRMDDPPVQNCFRIKHNGSKGG